MTRYMLAAMLLSLSVAANAQQMNHRHARDMNHGTTSATGRPVPAKRPTEPGQAAFAAIQEIISILDATPDTDWSRVDLEALRRHLADMNNVTLYAKATGSSVAGGMRYTVTGKGPVRESIRRMVGAHAAAMNGRNGWTFAAAEQPDGAILTVTVPGAADLAKVKGLGFIGIMAYGMHHQEHHLMIATGMAPHEHGMRR